MCSTRQVPLLPKASRQRDQDTRPNSTLTAETGFLSTFHWATLPSPITSQPVQQMSLKHTSRVEPDHISNIFWLVARASTLELSGSRFLIKRGRTGTALPHRMAGNRHVARMGQARALEHGACLTRDVNYCWANGFTTPRLGQWLHHPKVRIEGGGVSKITPGNSGQHLTEKAGTH